MQVISEQQLRDRVREPEALEAAELAFRALGQKLVTVPAPLALAVGERGELHVKCAYLHGSRFFVVKAATGFYYNPQRGLPSGSGLVLLFDAETGFPLVLFKDNGYLTELRTAAAGALAARFLARPQFQTVAIIGAGTQARYQLHALASAFAWTTTVVWARDTRKAATLCSELKQQIASELIPAATVEDAVRHADVIVTVTPSTTSLLHGAWLQPHATVIAVGSDSPEKRELADDVMARADKIVVDSLAQCARLGELHHAIESGTSSPDAVYAELGEIVAGAKTGRTGDELVVCDLTGLGAQDAAIAELAYQRVVDG